MKKIAHIFLFFMVALFATSCMNSGLDDLPTYSDAEITNIKFEYRWWSDNQLKVQELTTEKTIDKETNIIECHIKVPNASNAFSNEIRNKVELTSLSCSVDLSTAASLVPLDGAPKLGSPNDFSSRKFKYKVTAADKKTTKTWTVNINEFTK